MSIINPARTLDDLLTILKEHNTAIELVQLGDLCWKGNIEIEYYDLKRAVEKLGKDGYIDIITDFQGIVTYAVNFDGKLFHGYEKQKEIDGIKLSITVKNESRRLRNDHLLIVGTWFAGIAALLLLLWQVFLYFYPVHKDYPYWIWETIKH